MSRVLFPISIALLVLGVGCEVGPVRLTTQIAEGTLATTLFNTKATIPAQQTACDFPTEEDINMVFEQEVQGVDLSDIISISGLELISSRMEATQGNFSFLTGVEVSFIPAPVNGQPQDAVVLGTASAPSGFDSIIDLEPPEPVDLLALIRQNDSESSTGCPSIRYSLTFQTPPSQDVPFELSATVDASALVQP